MFKILYKSSVSLSSPLMIVSQLGSSAWDCNPLHLCSRRHPFQPGCSPYLALLRGLISALGLLKTHPEPVQATAPVGKGLEHDQEAGLPSLQQSPRRSLGADCCILLVFGRVSLCVAGPEAFGGGSGDHGFRLSKNLFILGLTHLVPNKFQMFYRFLKKIFFIFI